MYLIEIKPGEAPAITQGDAMRYMLYPDDSTEIVALDPGGMFLAAVSAQAQDWQTEPCCTIKGLGRMLYGTVQIFRNDYSGRGNVHAEDLGRVAGLLRLSDYYEEVSGL